MAKFLIATGTLLSILIQGVIVNPIVFFKKEVIEMPSFIIEAQKADGPITLTKWLYALTVPIVLLLCTIIAASFLNIENRQTSIFLTLIFLLIGWVISTEEVGETLHKTRVNNMRYGSAAFFYALAIAVWL